MSSSPTIAETFLGKEFTRFRLLVLKTYSLTLKNARRENLPAGVLLVFVDRFKRFGDFLVDAFLGRSQHRVDIGPIVDHIAKFGVYD